MIANADEVLYAGAAGYADVAREVPVTVDSIFRIASMTKPLTSLAAMQLAQEGRLRLDAPMSELLARLRTQANSVEALMITVLAEYSTDRPIRRLFANCWNPYIRVCLQRLEPTSVRDYGLFAVFADLLINKSRSCSSRELNGAYGTSSDWLGLIVETVSDSSLEAYFAQHITGPLGMVDTAYNLPASKRARVVTRHQRSADGSLTGTSQTTT